MKQSVATAVLAALGALALAAAALATMGAGVTSTTLVS